MLRGVLFDLDDTLLGNDMDVFLPAYLSALREYIVEQFSPESFERALLGGVRAMMTDADPRRTNAEVFWEFFSSQVGRRRKDVEPFLAVFYEREFPKLRALTERRAAAQGVLAACRSRGLQVVLATNPVFPRRAIEHRLDWAGLDAAAFDLVTTYENMHSTKPQVSYYLEIAARLSTPPAELLMVGNSVDADIEPAKRCGMHTFLVDALASPEQAAGSLEELVDWLKTHWAV